MDIYGSQDRMRPSNLDNLMATIKEKNCPKSGVHGHGHSAVEKTYASCFTGNGLDMNCLRNTVSHNIILILYKLE